MAKGTPERRTIAIHCAGCRHLLYRYRKGGTGALFAPTINIWPDGKP